ncbi:SRPBCC family protein [Pseudocolwellia agarivorans]|uniref:SRPBCC family protein n=1 Tax=Pseudocolwellia agarivorans TaxID=1911682 RepID=UPI000984EBB1|nr:SRPBCC family protein [Pseudocolwellia agarivorans]
MLKKLVLIVLTIIAIPLIVAVFTENSYEVERSVIINKPKEEVFNYIKYLKNQSFYSKWAQMDPNMLKTYRGIDGQVGFVSAWSSEKEDVGAGEQEIIAIDEGYRIDFELRFLKPFKSTDPAFMVTEAVDDNTTKVVWGFSGHMDYPMNLMLLFIDFEQVIGDDLQTGLNNLKAILD